MKTFTRKIILRPLALAPACLALMTAVPACAAFVYETAGEFFATGDFNGDGIPDALVLDKLTGNARVGYGDGNGHLTWSAPLVTGAPNLTGCGVERLLQTNRDCVAVTSPSLNVVNLVDLSQTNSAGVPQIFTPTGLGPHGLAGLRAPTNSPSPNHPFLFVASSFNYNNGVSELLELAQPPAAFYGSPRPETGPFDLPNGLDLNSNLPSLAVGMVRGGTNDTLHLWELDATNAVVGSFSNLPAGSQYAFGKFNGEAFPRFIFYQPGGSNLLIAPLQSTNSGYTFGAPLMVALDEPVQTVFTLASGTNGSALIQFGDGVQGLTLPNGSPSLSAKYQAGAGASGNVFTGVVPLTNGTFVLLDAPAGASSAHGQIVNFSGTTFTQQSALNLPPVSSRGSRANVWLFQLEPFVNRAPGFVESLNSPDWADGVSGLPGAIRVPTENDSGSTNGLGNVATNNLGAPPSTAAFGIANQYNPAISVFSFSAPLAAPSVLVTISPPAGAYGTKQSVSFTSTPPGSAVQYRAGSLDSWHTYSSPFSISNDVTVQYYGTNSSGGRAALQFASYTLGAPATSGTNSPIPTDPGNTNTVLRFSTNQLAISGDGTIFYGRVSASRNYTIWAIGLDGSDDTYITTGARPRVSADGKYLAFLRGGSTLVTQGSLYVRNLQAQTESLVFSNSTRIVGYDWDLTGTNLIFDWNCGLWSAGISGGAATLLPLPSPDCYDAAPAVDPVDGRLAFQNLNPSSSVLGIYVTTPARNSKQRINASVPGASWPSWSPDGNWLSFVDGNSSGTASSADSGTNLWVARADGSGLSQLSGFNDGTNHFPHGAIWTPDDSGLVAAGTIFGTNGLWLIPLTPDLMDCDGPPVLLPTSPGDAIDFAGSIVSAAPRSLLAAQPPGLFIRSTAGAVVVYWSTNYAGYTLESKTNILAGTWTAIAGPYFLAGGYFEYWEARNALSPEKFFRLHYTGAMILSQPPLLNIQLLNSEVQLSWASTASGFILQSKSDLSPAIPWNDVPGPYLTNVSGFLYNELPDPLRPRFYRLRSP